MSRAVPSFVVTDTTIGVLFVACSGGIVSAGFAPTRTTTSARPRSSSGNGSPRSTPKARMPAAAADDMQNRPL